MGPPVWLAQNPDLNKIQRIYNYNHAKCQSGLMGLNMWSSLPMPLWQNVSKYMLDWSLLTILFKP